MSKSDIEVNVAVNGLPPLLNSDALRPVMTALLLGVRDSFAAVESKNPHEAELAELKQKLEEMKLERDRFNRWWSEESQKNSKLIKEANDAKSALVLATTENRCKLTDKPQPTPVE